MTIVFYPTSNLYFDIGNSDVINVISFSRIFEGANEFNQDISNWDVNNGTNITCYSSRHYDAFRCHLKPIDSGNTSLSIGHSIESHHRNYYPYSKESTTTKAFNLAIERFVV